MILGHLDHIPRWIATLPPVSNFMISRTLNQLGSRICNSILWTCGNICTKCPPAELSQELYIVALSGEKFHIMIGNFNLRVQGKPFSWTG